jgi:Flp pilus assembly protein CpaB
MSRSKAVLVAFIVMVVGVLAILLGIRLNNPPVTVVQALHNIPKGQRFYAADLRVVTIPQSAFQPGFVPALSLVEGKYAAHYVPAGQYLVGPDIVPSGKLRDGLKQGEMGFWLGGSLVSLGGANIGARVDITWVPNSSNTKTKVMPRLLYTGVRVAAAYTSNGTPVGKPQANSGGLFQLNNSSGGVSTVVLAVNQTEFLQLAEAAQTGHLALTVDPWAKVNSGLGGSAGSAFPTGTAPVLTTGTVGTKANPAGQVSGSSKGASVPAAGS